MASTGTRPTSCGTSPAGCRRRSEPTPATQSSMAETPCGGLQLARERRALQPGPYTRAVATVDIAELALEIGFLAGDYTVADDEGEGHQHDQQPEIVERNGQADQTQEQAEVDGVAREAVRSALDDGGGRQVGGDVRASPGDGNDGPGEERRREDKHHRAEPACSQAGAGTARARASR